MFYFQKPLIVSVALILLLASCQHDVPRVIDTELISAIERVSPTGYTDFYVMPESDDYQNLPNQDPANPITKEKVVLGQLLFFETGLAQIPEKEACYETYSCSSCHVPTAGFLPGRIQGIADGGVGFGESGSNRAKHESYRESELDAQGTRPMNPLNSTYVTNTLWGGLFGADGVNVGTEYAWTGLAEVNYTGYTGLEAQNIEAFNLHRLEINDHILDDYGYRALYDAAFPDFDESERYTPVTSSFAISAFLRTMLTNEAPFQKWLKGDENAITDNQKEGALLFFDKARCYLCHREPSFSSMSFHVMGTKDMYEMGGLNTNKYDPRNLGRGMFTGKERDMFAFKVPQLYNLDDYAAYFHGSSKNELREVVEFKLKAESENDRVNNDQLSPLFQPVTLTNQEKEQLIDFLRNALKDPGLGRYVPEAILSGNCFPNNDASSKTDMGCE